MVDGGAHQAQYLRDAKPGRTDGHNRTSSIHNPNGGRHKAPWGELEVDEEQNEPRRAETCQCLVSLKD
eukprot:scaffold2088_cov399-Prasinococcus_capsulatus_cf.AAC.51